MAPGDRAPLGRLGGCERLLGGSSMKTLPPHFLISLQARPLCPDTLLGWETATDCVPGGRHVPWEAVPSGIFFLFELHAAKP